MPKRHQGVARGSDGRLIVAEVGARRLIEIAPDSGKVTEIAANLPIGLMGAPGGLPSNIPTGVAIGASGVIYFSSDIENAIYKVTRK
ncbi:glucose/arabinose dehydrogenase [Bradyrhizobium sp. LA8.1]